MTQWDQLLDTQGLACPLPLLKAKQAMSRLQVGQMLKVLATDAGSEQDFRVWTNLVGHNLYQCQHINNVYHYLIIKGPA
jgi:tRNA 2-thiouridine synthesizing protein A